MRAMAVHGLLLARAAGSKQLHCIILSSRASKISVHDYSRLMSRIRSLRIRMMKALHYTHKTWNPGGAAFLARLLILCG